MVGRDALILAARTLLERLPPAKVTRAAVARQAGVDPSLIRYYFKDRSSLLIAVLERIVDEAAAVRPPAPGCAAIDKLQAYVREFFAFHARSPFVHRLLIEEIAQSEAAAGREAFHRLNQVAIATLREILGEGARDGTLVSAEPVLLHIAIIGLCEFFFASGVLLEDALGVGTAPRQLADRYGELIVELVLRGLRAPS